MCISQPKASPPPPPAPPPPPPPVLEQAAPSTAASSQGDQLKKTASGTKKYRTGLSITSESAGNTGLGIAS